MPRILIISVGLALGFLSSFAFSFADEATNPDSEFTTDSSAEAQTEDQACAAVVGGVGAVRLAQYQDFLNRFYTADQASSEQLEDGVRYYRYVEDAIWKAFENASKKSPAGTLLNAQDNYNDCARIRDDYLMSIRLILERHLLTSAVSKPTFKLVDGLKIMNEDVSTLSVSFHEVFPDLFSSMSSQFQCYLRECIQR